MYNQMAMPPPWVGWGYPPMPPQTNTTPDLHTIREWSKMLKDWEKEIKGDEKKKPDSKGPNASVVSVMLLMLLLSPITGPTMYHFFQLSLGILQNAK